jgi:hypothetical protein
MKLLNGQRNSQAFNLFIYLILPYVFRACFKPEACKTEVNRLKTCALRWSLCNFIQKFKILTKKFGIHYIRFTVLQTTVTIFLNKQ